MVKRSAWLLLLLPLLRCGVAKAQQSAVGDKDPPPNIVFILADDVGVEPLGCYGGQSVPTPNIDRLAATGQRYTHCYSMPVCHPTRVCFLTGAYPRRLGNPKWGTFPQEHEQHTVANTLRSAGYATVVVGKWQLSLLSKDLQQPHRMGFDEYCVFGWHEGPRYHDPLVFQNGKRRDGLEGTYGPDVYVDYLVDFFKRHKNKPFFAFYSMALCHDVTDDLAAPVPYVPGKSRYLSYQEMVASMDQCVGRVTKALDQVGIRDRTWIVFTGDNGTSVGSIGRAEQRDDQPAKWRYIRDKVELKFRGESVGGGKGSLTDGGTHVPLIVNRPRVTKPSVKDDSVDFSDFLPTFAEWGKAAAPSWKHDGVSFAKQAREMTNPDARQWAYSEGKGRYWVRTQRFKRTSDGKLYDLKASPAEVPSANLADSDRPDLQSVRTQLDAAIKQVSTLDK